MANLTADRKTKMTTDVYVQPIAGPFDATAATRYYRGLAYAVDANGRLVNPAAGLVVPGFCLDPVDNSAGANGAVKVPLNTGRACFDAHGVNPPTVADIGQLAYFSDNHTVSRTSTDGAKGGRIDHVDADGVWVLMGVANF